MTLRKRKSQKARWQLYDLLRHRGRGFQYDEPALYAGAIASARAALEVAQHWSTLDDARVGLGRLVRDLEERWEKAEREDRRRYSEVDESR